MLRLIARFVTVFLIALFAAPPALHAALPGRRHAAAEAAQETGFLNRKLERHGMTYRYQVYLPEEWRREDHRQWPVILFLHGRGERGSEGLWQTQVGLPEAVRDHPERWPFVIVIPQCPLGNYWTDPEMQAVALDALDHEVEEFHGDPDRTYLTGLSMGGYGSWELARQHPRRWAAVAIMAGGLFWSYEPDRWRQIATLPAEYAHALGRTPLWLFHGSDDSIVIPRQSELMFEAVKAAGGHVRLWVYQGLKHDCWTRAYDEPELPRWLMAHRAEPPPRSKPGGAPDPPTAERLFIPLHPPAIKLATLLLDGIVGEYRDQDNRPAMNIYRQGEQLYERTLLGETYELAAESPGVFFYPNGSSGSRLTIERDQKGHVSAAIYRDDRHEERWEKRFPGAKP